MTLRNMNSWIHIWPGYMSHVMWFINFYNILVLKIIVLHSARSLLFLINLLAYFILYQVISVYFFSLVLTSSFSPEFSCDYFCLLVTFPKKYLPLKKNYFLSLIILHLFYPQLTQSTASSTSFFTTTSFFSSTPIYLLHLSLSPLSLETSFCFICLSSSSQMHQVTLDLHTTAKLSPFTFKDILFFINIFFLL